tara:strand:- start:1613 stop:2818 length:1206 start_codon:yes stop_codon:yes gene_type:complete
MVRPKTLKKKLTRKRNIQRTSRKRINGGAWLNHTDGYPIDPKTLRRVKAQSGFKRIISDKRVAKTLYNVKNKSLSWKDFLNKNKLEYNEKYNDSFDNILKRLNPNDIGPNLTSEGKVRDIIERDIEQWCPIGTLKDPIKYFKTKDSKEKYVGIEIFHRYYGEGEIVHYDKRLSRRMGYGWMVKFKEFPNEIYTFYSTNSLLLGSRGRHGKKGQKGNILIKQPPEYLIQQMWTSYNENKTNTVLRNQLFKAMKSYPLVYSDFCDLVFNEGFDPSSLSEDTTEEYITSELNNKGKKLWDLDKKHRMAFKDVIFPNIINPNLNSFHKFCLTLKRFNEHTNETLLIDEWWRFYKDSRVNYNFFAKYSNKKITGGGDPASLFFSIIVCLICLASQFQCLLIFLLSR